MNVDLTTEDLKALVRGSSPHYDFFENPLVEKAGHSYNDQYGKTQWDSLSELTDAELWELYNICKKGWVPADGK